MSEESLVFSNIQNAPPDTEAIKNAVKHGFPLSITTYTFPIEIEQYINQVLKVFLHELDQDYMTEYLAYCLKELIINSKKANTKRVYFKERHLNIAENDDYKRGMESFKNDTIKDITRYLALQRQAGLYIKLTLQVKNNYIKLEIKNNTELTVHEYKRIHDKLTRSVQFHSIPDAAMNPDETEGAGLGLIIICMILQKLGVQTNNITVQSQNGETAIGITIPVFHGEQQHMLLLSEEIAKKIAAVPAFPENITKINRLLDNPQTKITEIVEAINNDAGLTADLLRMVNNASLRRTSPCTDVATAVKMVGLRNIKNLLYTIGTIKNLMKSDKDQKILWDHAAQTAIYSYVLSCRFFRNEYNVISDAYVCGLLHDIGKILFESAHPDTLNIFEQICTEKSIPFLFFEKIIAGANHGEIGALITTNWNFPTVITNAIRYHHNPNQAPEEFKKSVRLVYLANMITHYQNGTVSFRDFDTETLEVFNLNSEEQLAALAYELNGNRGGGMNLKGSSIS